MRRLSFGFVWLLCGGTLLCVVGTAWLEMPAALLLVRLAAAVPGLLCLVVLLGSFRRPGQRTSPRLAWEEAGANRRLAWLQVRIRRIEREMAVLQRMEAAAREVDPAFPHRADLEARLD